MIFGNKFQFVYLAIWAHMITNACMCVDGRASSSTIWERTKETRKSVYTLFVWRWLKVSLDQYIFDTFYLHSVHYEIFVTTIHENANDTADAWYFLCSNIECLNIIINSSEIVCLKCIHGLYNECYFTTNSIIYILC